LGIGKELIGNSPKLTRYQEAGCRSVVLVHRLPNLDVNVQLGGNDLSCLDRFPFAAGDNLRCA
jgi:hypothetical protein